MEKPVVVKADVVTVKMGYDNSVDARNFLAQVGHLMEYDGPKSEQIVFRIDSDSLHQAAEWGLDLWTILRRLRKLCGKLPKNESQLFYYRVFRHPTWTHELKVHDKGEYRSWLTKRDSYRSVSFWTKLRIVQSFWLLKRFGRSIGYSDLPKGVRSAIGKRKESWWELVGFAGLNPLEEQTGKKNRPLLSSEETVSEILKRHSAGKPLGVKAVRLDDWNLHQSGVAHFRGWFEAVEAAGIRIASESTRVVWTRSDFISEVQDIKNRGEAINFMFVETHYPRLRASSRYHFESWDQLIAEAGFDPHEERLNRSWKLREDLLVELLGMKEAGLPINPAALRRHHNIYQALCEYYDSWEKAVEAAGFNPDEERVIIPWSKEMIVAEIRYLKECGEPIYQGYLWKRGQHYRNLYKAMRLHFGSWEEAVKAAGYKPGEVRYRR